MLERIANEDEFKYVFTRSSFNAIDVAFRVFTNFILYDVKEYYYNQEEQKILVYLFAKNATLGPPLGTLLIQYKINTVMFCKKFNEKTKILPDNLLLKVIIF